MTDAGASFSNALPLCLGFFKILGRMSEPQVSQQLKQTQSLALAPVLQQSLQVLQAPVTELNALAREALEQNPLLEEDVPVTEQPVDEAEDFFEWDGASSVGQDVEKLQRARELFFENQKAGHASLRESLLEQALFLDLKRDEKKALVYLIDSLDENGLLSGDIGELARSGGFETATLEGMLKLLQSFDPPGIGARDLRECLLLQLERAGKAGTLAEKIVREHFEQLGKRKVVEIARAEKTTPAAVEQALKTIRRLSPAPGRPFSQDSVRVIVPDLFFEKKDGIWKVRLNDEAAPRLRLSNEYKNMLGRANLSDGDRSYLNEQIHAARTLVEALAQRAHTLEKIGRALLKRQRRFFEDGPDALKPLTMAQVADDIAMHESTVGRAVSGKYAQTPWGVFELRYFFTHGYQSEDGQTQAVETVKQRIAEMVAQEDARRPLSDQRIAELLAAQGLSVARRTIAKYREALGIAPVAQRRRYS